MRPFAIKYYPLMTESKMQNNLQGKNEKLDEGNDPPVSSRGLPNADRPVVSIHSDRRKFRVINIFIFAGSRSRCMRQAKVKHPTEIVLCGISIHNLRNAASPAVP